VVLATPPEQITSLNIFRSKELLDSIQDIFLMEVLTREDIKIRIARLLAEVRGDVGCLYQLDKSVSSFVSGPESHNMRSAVSNHINIFNQPSGKNRDVMRTTNKRRLTASNIKQ
jgi:hypothetical protein